MTTLSHRLHRGWQAKLVAAIPFGLGQIKPKHFRDMVRIIWKNRDNLGYAWKVLSRGVCDGCALGVAGLKDWTVKGPHLCMTRLNLLRLNTVAPLDESLLADVAALEKLDNAQLRELGRLPYPFLREKNARGFRRISWDEAYRRMAARLRASDPRRVAFFITARGVTNEVYYMSQKVARFLGTSNIDNAARICHSPSTAAMKAGLGVAATTCSYTDWYGTDLIIFFGANPANDQPVTTKYLHEAKKLGAKVVMVNPYREPGMERYWVPSNLDSALFGSSLMDYWFPVTQGGDIAFLYGVFKVLFANGWVNHDFLTRHIAGLEELRQKAESLDWAVLETQAGLSRASMTEFAELVRDAKNGVLVWSMGITQHAFGADGVSMVLNLGLLRGYIGRDKNGLMPIRGHSSVQGGAEMGAYSTMLPGAIPLNAENCQRLAEQYGFSIPSERGLTTTEMVEAAASGKLDLFYSVGGNLLRNLPEPEQVRAALANVPMRVHQDIILNDQMLIPAREEVLLLPAKTRYEQDDGGVETSTERRVMFSPEIPRQVGEARAEWKILRDLAVTAYPERAYLMGCETGWKMREEIVRVVPFYDGIQDFRKTGDSFQYGGPHLCPNGQFPTKDGKGHLVTVPLPDRVVPATLTNGHVRKGQATSRHFVVSTRRGKQFNSLIYAEVDPLTGAGRDAVLICPEDATDLHLIQNDRVRLKNDLGELECRVFLAPIARGNLQVHWPEGNVIIRRGIVDAGGGVPDYNAQVTVERVVN